MKQLSKSRWGFVPIPFALSSSSFYVLVLGLLSLSLGCKSDTSTGPGQAAEKDGYLYTVAGVAGEAGGSGNGGPAVKALLYWPQDIITNNAGEIYIVDWNNHCVRKIAVDGTISRAIGSGNLGDERTGPADEINLNHPTSLTIGPQGNFWLSAWHNWTIKLIDTKTWMVSTPIGTVQGLAGDGGPASQARLDLPSSLVFDPAGNMYLSDQGNQRIRKVDSQMVITTLAGSDKGFADGIGEDAKFSFPRGSDASPGGKIAISDHGDEIYVADTENHRIRKIHLATRQVTTIAGTGEAGYSGDGGPALSATLNYPTDLVFTEDHEIFIADSRNHVIRKIDAFGNISTVVGTGIAGTSPDGTLAKSAMLNLPFGVYFDDANNTLYVADTFNHQVKRVKNPL